MRPRALIVDENEVDRYTMAKLLEPLDIAVIESGGADAALAAIAEVGPSVILLDAGVEGSGLAPLAKLKGDGKTRSIPVILLVSDPQTETREQALRLGADDFVEKPVTRENLIPRIRRFVV
ncbi:MAG: response regulator [Nitrospinae bacterium]|nr:response regulator [Nitrospinota bacterium]